MSCVFKMGTKTNLKNYFIENVLESKGYEGSFHAQWQQQACEYFVHWYFAGAGIGPVYRLLPVETGSDMSCFAGQQSIWDRRYRGKNLIGSAFPEI